MSKLYVQEFILETEITTIEVRLPYRILTAAFKGSDLVVWVLVCADECLPKEKIVIEVLPHGKVWSGPGCLSHISTLQHPMSGQVHHVFHRQSILG